jgi:hypothetical protein
VENEEHEAEEEGSKNSEDEGFEWTSLVSQAQVGDIS